MESICLGLPVVLYFLDGISLTISVNWSRQAMRIFSAVAGAQNSNVKVFPCSLRKNLMASLTAKKTDAARNNGGSPTP